MTANLRKLSNFSLNLVGRSGDYVLDEANATFCRNHRLSWPIYRLYGICFVKYIIAAEFDDIKSAADAERKLVNTAPTVNGHIALRQPDVLKLLELRNQVVQKSLKRVEVRACNLGGD